MDPGVDRDLAALEPVDHVQVPQQPRAVDAGLVQLAYRCAELLHRSRRIEREAMHMLRCIGMLVGPQVREPRRAA